MRLLRFTHLTYSDGRYSKNQIFPQCIAMFSVYYLTSVAHHPKPIFIAIMVDFTTFLEQKMCTIAKSTEAGTLSTHKPERIVSNSQIHRKRINSKMTFIWLIK
jgi:hypothetical protein